MEIRRRLSLFYSVVGVGQRANILSRLSVWDWGRDRCYVAVRGWKVVGICHGRGLSIGACGDLEGSGWSCSHKHLVDRVVRHVDRGGVGSSRACRPNRSSLRTSWVLRCVLLVPADAVAVSRGGDHE